MTDNPPLAVPSDRNASGRSFGDAELRNLRAVLESGALNSNGGSFVPRFESSFAAALGVKHGIACSSGSLAVQAALAACALPKGAEVVTSPITDFGAITAILYEGLQPRFCDVDPETLMPTPESVERALTERSAAVVLTHLFGRIADVDGILRVCRARGLRCIEDAAQTLGSARGGRKPGSFGDLGAFSFQQSKQISSGEGGAIVTDDRELARRARLFVNKAWPYGEADPDHRFVAPNGRLTELQAAVLVAQLERLDGFAAARGASAAAFEDALREGLGSDHASLLTLPAVPAGDVLSPWRLHVRSAPELDLASWADRLRADGVPCAPHYVVRAAFELQAMREAGFEEDVADFPGVVDGLARCAVLPWNERITVELARAIGARCALRALESRR